jgi:hypothetical protein
VPGVVTGKEKAMSGGTALSQSELCFLSDVIILAVILRGDHPKSGFGYIICHFHFFFLLFHQKIQN